MPTQPTIRDRILLSLRDVEEFDSFGIAEHLGVKRTVALAATLQKMLQRDRYLKRVLGKMPEFWYRPTEIGLAECDRKTKQAQTTKSKTTKTK